MKLIYIVGKYTAKTTIGKLINIYRARRAAKRLWSYGYAVICPHSNSALMDRYAPLQVFYDGTIEMLKKCDYIYLLKDWEKSKGARAEYQTALKYGIEIWGAE